MRSLLLPAAAAVTTLSVFVIAFALPAQDALAPDERLRRLADRFDNLQHKVATLDDEYAIANLQRSYGYYVDKAQWSQVVDLFAEDGTLEIGGRGVFVGKQRVRDYLEFLGPEGPVEGHLYNHMQLQPIITVAPDGLSAFGRWHFIAQPGQLGVSARWGIGVYENEYVKQDGIWRIQRLHSYFRMYTPYADGWGKTANPITRPEPDLPPDRPPTVVYDQYPATYIPPAHYPHPVTGRMERSEEPD